MATRDKVSNQFRLGVLLSARGLKCILWFNRDFIRNHCWLANNTGKREDFLPFDRAQEHNNLDIKVRI